MPIDWKDLSKKSKHVPSFLKANFNFMPTLAYASLFHKLFPALKRLKQPKSQIFVKMPNISATQDQVFFQGFGTSLSWWANGIDKHASEMYANLFFGLDLVDTGSQHGVMPGLGMQVVR